MARDNWDDENDENFEANDSNLVKDLRKQLREALKARDDATAEVTTLRGVTRKTSLQEVLSSKNLNPKLSAFYPSDGEVTPEAVDAWVKEYADVFGIQTQVEESAEPNLDPAQAAAYQRMVASDVAGGGPGSVKEHEIAAKIAAATSPEELMKILGGQH